jgi:hypothetical protein
MNEEPGVPVGAPRRVTIVEIARRAGVSPSAASRALRGRYGVSEALRNKVNQAARDLADSHDDESETLGRMRRAGGQHIR